MSAKQTGGNCLNKEKKMGWQKKTVPNKNTIEIKKDTGYRGTLLVKCGTILKNKQTLMNELF